MLLGFAAPLLWEAGKAKIVAWFQAKAIYNPIMIAIRIAATSR
jgi:hypothetical protein